MAEGEAQVGGVLIMGGQPCQSLESKNCNLVETRVRYLLTDCHWQAIKLVSGAEAGRNHDVHHVDRC